MKKFILLSLLLFALFEANSQSVYPLFFDQVHFKNFNGRTSEIFIYNASADSIGAVAINDSAGHLVYKYLEIEVIDDSCYTITGSRDTICISPQTLSYSNLGSDSLIIAISKGNQIRIPISGSAGSSFWETTNGYYEPIESKGIRIEHNGFEFRIDSIDLIGNNARYAGLIDNSGTNMLLGMVQLPLAFGGDTSILIGNPFDDWSFETKKGDTRIKNLSIEVKGDNEVTIDAPIIRMDGLFEDYTTDFIIAFDDDDGALYLVHKDSISGGSSIENIYTNDGTLLTNRTIDADNLNLFITDANAFGATATNIGLEAGNAFELLGVNSITLSTDDGAIFKSDKGSLLVEIGALGYNLQIADGDSSAIYGYVNQSLSSNGSGQTIWQNSATGDLPYYADDADAALDSYPTGSYYQTDGTGANPLNAVGIVMIKQ